jgi:alpha-amylase
MGVMMQGFYWDCHRIESKVEKWWLNVAKELEGLANVGFTGIWLPPAQKSDARLGMGYDPYDYFDIGEFDQRGGVPTGFGTRQQLIELIHTAHGNGLQVYADVVFNHCSGGGLEKNPDTGEQYYTSFMPASGRFPRNYACFNPSRFESWDAHEKFGGFPDLCHRHPEVYRWLLENACFLIEEVGFDGFRFDMVKGYGAWLITALLEYRYRPKDGRRNTRDEYGWEYWRPFAFGESWSSDREIHEWIDAANSWSDNPVSAFDFPLRYRLKELCDNSEYSLLNLERPGVISDERPFQAVTFVDNHDFRGGDAPPIINDKMLGYAYILTHPGYPCIFWEDYFNHGLALPGQPSGIDALVEAHESYAGGHSIVRYVTDDLYIMERYGWDTKPGLIFVLNTVSDRWQGAWIDTTHRDTVFSPVAWRGKANQDKPLKTRSENDARAQFWAPPRGYAVYVPS